MEAFEERPPVSVGKKVAKDTYLFREGDHPDAMYIVKSGGFAITKTKGNSEVTLAEISTGAMVGEMAIFDKKPRSANVKAVKDSEVVALPYDALDKQLDALPVWIKAILRTMNDNLREANKKIKILENPDTEQDRFPPHVINMMLSLINLVGFKFGQKDEAGTGVVIPSNKLRNFTIQIFQQPTNKMDATQTALKELGMFNIEDLGEGRKKLVNLQPEFLFDFVDWYNEWLFKQDKDKVSLTSEEVKVLDALICFAKKIEPDGKGFRKVNLGDVQNDSMRDVGFLVKVDDCNSLIEKKFLSEKLMEESGVFLMISLEEVEKPARYWKFLWDLKKNLK